MLDTRNGSDSSSFGMGLLEAYALHVTV